MLPKSTITIRKGGSHTIVGEEKSDQCHKLSDMAKEAGKVVSDKKRDHTPVYQTVHNSKKGE